MVSGFFQGSWPQTALHERLLRVIPSPATGLVYPTEFLNLNCSPAICASPMPDFHVSDLELEKEATYHDFDSLLRQRPQRGALSAAFRDCGWAESEQLSPETYEKHRKTMKKHEKHIFSHVFTSFQGLFELSKTSNVHLRPRGSVATAPCA